MLLIDATNLSQGGGGALLRHLLSEFAGLSFKAIVSEKTAIPCSTNVVVTQHQNPLSEGRQKIIEQALHDYRPTTVFCFGNIPPKRPLKVARTVTYFQNAHLVSKLDQRCRYGIRDRIRYHLLRRSIRKWLGHSNTWVFQSEFIREAFQKEYGRVAESPVLPFFDKENLRATCAKVDQAQARRGFIYLSDDRPHKNHSRLLDAWSLLKSKFGLTPELHLTIPSQNIELIKRISDLVEQGLDIKNHGILPREVALELTASCQYVVFPSLLETLGLGVVEGCLLGCKVLVSNDRAFDDIIRPSDTFDPMSSESIANSVARAINELLPEPTIILQNKIVELTSLLFSTS